MADRYAFQSPFSRGAGANPWFMAGPVAVTTTVFVTAMGFFGILLVVIEAGFGTVSQLLLLDNSAITQGQLWRFVTHPIPPSEDFLWAILGLIFFYLIGSQFEGMLGRRAYTSLILALAIIPAVLAVLVAITVNTNIASAGLSMMFLGLAAGYSSAVPQARSFFGIPFWALVAFIFVVQMLTVLASRNGPGMAMLLSTGAIGLVMTRSLGFSSVEWIPAVPLPEFVTGSGATTVTKSAKPKRRKKRGSSGHLSAVPSPAASEAEVDALLDQVSEQGIESLTKQQKQTLERHSKELRKRRDS